MNEKTVETTVETTILQNLEYVKASIQNGTLESQKEILKLILQDTIQSIKDYQFTFKVGYCTETQKQHFQNYINQALKKKASLLADMEEMERELFTRNGKPKRALTIINKMLVTGLYKSEVAYKIGKWVNTTSFATKSEIIYTN